MSITTKVYANVLAMQSEGRMTAERLRRIVEAKTVTDAFKMLGDFGYAYSELNSADKFIVAETNALIDFIEENCAGERFASALTARFRYNNAKLAYKSRFIEVPSDGYYRTSLDCAKIVAGDYSDVGKYMLAALESLDESEERRPQAIDLALTRAMYEEVLSCGILTVKKYFRAETDMKNILSAARMRRLDTDGDEFIDGGKISRELLETSVHADGFADCFEGTPYEEYAAGIEASEFRELWRAERDADDYLFYMTARDVANVSSYEPFLNYYTQALIELKTVKTALVCIKTDSRDAFYQRIPKIYG